MVSLLSISLQGLNYPYQPIDCLRNTVLIYFRDSTHSRGPISSQLLSAAQFHQQLPFQILKRPSIARKRLLRKRFKFVKQARDTEKVVKNVNLFNSQILLRIESILSSSIGQDFHDSVIALSEGSLFFSSPSIQLQISKKDPRVIPSVDQTSAKELDSSYT